MIKQFNLIKENLQLNQLLKILKNYYFKACQQDYLKVGHNHSYLKMIQLFLGYNNLKVVHVV